MQGSAAARLSSSESANMEPDFNDEMKCSYAYAPSVRDEAIAPNGMELEAELTHWKEDGAIKRIIRARTCVVLRYWLSTFFAVDFLKNRRLGIMMTNWLNMVSRSRLLDKLPDAKVRVVSR